jgi:single-strand DNA-binding protein
VSDSSGTLIGNLTREPELRFGAGGGAVLGGGLAVNKRKKVGDDWEESTSFFNFVAFGSLAENMAASLTKGSRVVLSGHWEARPYETKEGESRTSTEFVVDEAGPSLRWATAEVTKVEKSEGGAAKGGKPAPRQKPASDEEPF